jgi:hypothetical protein
MFYKNWELNFTAVNLFGKGFKYFRAGNMARYVLQASKIVGIAFLQRASVASKEICSRYGFHKYPLLKDNELYRGLKAFLELIMFLQYKYI